MLCVLFLYQDPAYRLLRPIFVNQALPNYGEMAANLDKNASGDGAEEFVMLKDDPK